MLFVQDWIIKIASKKDTEPKPAEMKMGDYFKYFYCEKCGHAVYDRAIKNVECCAKCGREPMDRVVGRWEFNYFESYMFSGYKAVKFHPKSKEGCDESRN